MTADEERSDAAEREAGVPVARLLEALRAECAAIGRRVQIMEVCGTHTVSIFRSGLRSLLPENLRLISGPGCPVCVTAQRHIDAALEIAAHPEVTLATYGDMLRVPGKLGSLERLRARGARVRVVGSVRTALQLARREPGRQVVFLGVGFETTAPATAATVLEAAEQNVQNFSVLAAHKLVVPAMQALLAAGDVPLDGFLCPGHVSVIIGTQAYRPIVSAFHKPCVVAGFEPESMVRALLHIVRQVAAGAARVENVYPEVVGEVGNLVAQTLLQRIFRPADTPWRALGVIPKSGLEFAPRWAQFDALRRFGVLLGRDADHPACRCGDVISGRCEPRDCPLFARACTPLNPIGPCMVSSEGTCAAWHRYGREPADAEGVSRQWVTDATEPNRNDPSRREVVP